MLKGVMSLTVKKCSNQPVAVLDEIIENAMELPVESQKLVLMIAKAMKYTRDCELRDYAAKRSFDVKTDGVVS